MPTLFENALLKILRLFLILDINSGTRAVLFMGTASLSLRKEFVFSYFTGYRFL
jgi:hypothetical protein